MKYTCNCCDHEFEHTNTPLFTREVKTRQGLKVYNNPVCPVCWEKFIRSNIGIGISTWEKLANDAVLPPDSTTIKTPSGNDYLTIHNKQDYILLETPDKISLTLDKKCINELTRILRDYL